ncbi:MAG TPA: hypothetical protein VGV59_04005, partial [Pyrinomonadaceae bacterium]|nr:hypothetical protein [Pyrinomonadaceae bacterium]
PAAQDVKKDGRTRAWCFGARPSFGYTRRAPDTHSSTRQLPTAPAARRRWRATFSTHTSDSSR